jgi:hypothetical protein
MGRINLYGVENNDIVCGDFDYDSDLDLLVCGKVVNPIGGEIYNASIYRNDLLVANNPPTAPTGLNYEFEENNVNISWNPAFDDKTPSAGLNYNLRIGTNPSNMDILAAHAELPVGNRWIVTRGNTGGNISWTINGLDFGVYYASVQAIDPSYRGSAFSTVIDIELSPSATFTMSEIACVNSEVKVTYTGNASSTAQYNWDFDNGSANPGIGPGPHTVIWDTPGTKTVSLIVTENGATSDPFYLDVDVVVPPAADAGADQSITQGTSTQLSGSASGGSGLYSYYWMPDSLLLNPDQPNPTTIPLENTEQFTLEVTDTESGCIAYDNMIVYISGGPLTLTVSADPDTLCEGDGTQLLALAGGGSTNYTYLWTSNPPGFTSNDTNPVAYPSIPTTYYVELSDGNESLTDSVFVWVWPLPHAAGSISGPAELCVGSEQVLYEIDPVPEATAYLWELSEGLIGNSNTNTILLTFPPFVNDAIIKVSPVNDCGLGEFSVMEVEMLDVPETPLQPNGPDSLCTTTDTTGQYQISEPAPGALSYEWELLPEDAGAISGDGMNADVQWVKNWTGQATVRVRALNECGLSNWSEALEIWAFNCLGVSDADHKGIEIIVYPNPADKKLNVGCWMLDEYVKLELRITDIFGGEIIKTSHPGEGVVEIDISDIPAGMYILFLHGNNGLKVTQRVVIQH